MPIKTVVNEKYGYRQLAEIPDVEWYYEKEYFSKKLDKPTEKEKADRAWLNETFYWDIIRYLQEHGCEKVLDVGCGKGWLVDRLNSKGFKAFGVDPGIRRPKSEKEFYQCKIEAIPLREEFDAIIMLNVLEHVPNPEEFLSYVKRLLKPGGHLICQVPNDFSEFQKASKKGEYWVVTPDHINYFNKLSLISLLAGNSFCTNKTTGDFPMELFLLMGVDYIGMPAQGKVCHEMRAAFEQSLDSKQQQDLYDALSALGHGRNVIAYAQKRAE